MKRKSTFVDTVPKAINSKNLAWFLIFYKNRKKMYLQFGSKKETLEFLDANREQIDADGDVRECHWLLFTFSVEWIANAADEILAFTRYMTKYDIEQQ